MQIEQRFKNQSTVAIVPDQVILHSLANGYNFEAGVGWLTSPSNPLESHYAVSQQGRVVQLVPENRRAEANYKANKRADGHGAISIETDSSVAATEPWTDPQCEALIELIAGICRRHSIPVRPCPGWDQSGIGYHIQFGSPGQWTPVAKSCPGPQRIRQVTQVIIPGVARLLAGGLIKPSVPTPQPQPQAPSAGTNDQAPHIPYPGYLLKKGETSNYVGLMQRRLKQHLNSVGVTFDYSSAPGTFGPRTESAVRTFQMLQGFPPRGQDGVVGPDTWRRLFDFGGPLPA